MKFESFLSLPLPSKKKEGKKFKKLQAKQNPSPSQSVFLLLEIVECKCAEQLLLLLWEKGSGGCCLMLKFFVSVLIVAGIGIAVSPAKGT